MLTFAHSIMIDRRVWRAKPCLKFPGGKGRLVLKGYGKEDITHGFVWSLSTVSLHSVWSFSAVFGLSFTLCSSIHMNQRGLFRSPPPVSWVASFLTKVYGSWLFIVRICDTVTQKRSVGTAKFGAYKTSFYLAFHLSFSTAL